MIHCFHVCSCMDAVYHVVVDRGPESQLLGFPFLMEGGPSCLY